MSPDEEYDLYLVALAEAYNRYIREGGPMPNLPPVQFDLGAL